MTRSTREQTAAVLGLASSTDVNVGLVDVPVGGPPYAVLYPLGGAGYDGSLHAQDLDEDAWPTWQVTTVGVSPEQAEGVRDAIRAAVLGQTLTVASSRLGPVRLLDEQGVTIDHDVTPPLFYAIDRYRAYSTPT